MPQIHPRFGEFEEIDGGVELSCRTAWLDTPCTLSLIVDDRGVPEKLADTASRLLDRAGSLQAALETKVTASLYDTWRTAWREDDQSDLSAAEWWDHFRVSEIAIYPEDEFAIALSDGGLFAGHVTLVSGSLKDGPTVAQLTG